MDKLISVLMPSKNPPDWLDRALLSIRETCGGSERVEILIKIDAEDELRDVRTDLGKKHGAISIISTRGNGYLDMGRFVDELLAAANGRWVWLFDDDAMVIGNEWLQQVPDENYDCALKCENYQLGKSYYHREDGPVGLLVPRKAVLNLHVSNPVDAKWHNWLITRGWPIRFLLNTTYWHEGRQR